MKKCKHCEEPKEELVGRRLVCDSCRKAKAKPRVQSLEYKAKAKAYQQIFDGKMAQKRSLAPRTESERYHMLMGAFAKLNNLEGEKDQT